jgi:hypothetical protein
MKDIKARMYVAHTHTKAGINQIHIAEDEFSQQTFFFWSVQNIKVRAGIFKQSMGARN